MNRNGALSWKSPRAVSTGTIPLFYDEGTKEGINSEMPQHQIAGFTERKHGMYPVSKAICLQKEIPQTSNE
jgi:hypothetical protein